MTCRWAGVHQRWSEVSSCVVWQNRLYQQINQDPIVIQKRIPQSQDSRRAATLAAVRSLPADT
eukprot:5425317-Lingulodinium_polyedra.AAC.1